MTAAPISALVTYAVCAVAYAALAVLIVGQARRSRTGLWLAGAAACTAAWAAAWLTAPMPVTAALDLVRLLAWYAFCLHLYRRAVAGADRTFTGLGVVAALCSAVAIWFGLADLAGPVSLLHPAVLLRLLLAIGQLLLLENLYRDTDPEQRWHIVLACSALGGLAAYDVVVCADAVLLHGASHTLLTGRAAIALLAAPVLAVAAARNRNWQVNIHVSRTAAFHTATLVISGIFLLALSAVGELARRFGPTFGAGWGGLAQVYVVCAGILTLAVLLTSGSARSVLRRGVVDHFFTHRFDYRQEWQRCIRTLSAARPLPERVIRALADVVDSPSGLLFLREPGQAGLAWGGAWNAPPSAALTAEDARRLIDQGPALVPADLGARSALSLEPWLAVPLHEPSAGEPRQQEADALGCILLARPRAPFRLDAEVFDLLHILAHEAAIHLAQDRAANTVLQTRELTAYSERFAFVAHDIKNVSSQLSLLLANAETHLSDPDFQKDMLATVRASVTRIGGLIRRLQPVRASETPNAALIAPARVDAAALLATMIEGRPRDQRPAVAFDRPEIGRDAVTVGMEEAALQAAVTHLLDNAVTAAGPSGTVGVALRTTETHAVIDIADSGPGMTPEFIRDELFRPFATHTEGGSGLGAFQARSLLRAAGGELAVLSTPGHGTTMRLSVPLVAAADRVRAADLAPIEA